MKNKKKLKNTMQRKESLLTRAQIQSVTFQLYPSLRNKPSESNEFKKAIQVVRRCFQSYTADTNKDEPVNKKKKFHQSGGGRKPVALEVCIEIF